MPIGAQLDQFIALVLNTHTHTLLLIYVTIYPYMYVCMYVPVKVECPWITWQLVLAGGVNYM